MTLPAILVAENAETLARLDDTLKDLADLEIVQKAPTLASAIAAMDEITTPSPFLVVVDLGQDPDDALRGAEELNSARSDCHIVMTSADKTPEIVLRAFRAGAEEFFTQPFDKDEILEAVHRLAGKVQQRATAERAGQIITVFSSKGGVGTTTLATNLAVAIQTHPHRPQSVCVVDLDLQFGSISTFFNIAAPYNIIDLAMHMDRADALFLESALGKHGSGVRVLSETTAPADPNQAPTVAVEQILELLTHSFDFVIVDCCDQINDLSVMAFQKSSLMLMVMVMDIPSLQGTHKAMSALDRLNIPPGKLRLIINRYVKNKFFKSESVTKVLGTQPFWMLPEDRLLTTTALNQGLSVIETKPKSALAKSYRGLGEAVVESLTPETTARKPRRSGFLSRVAASFM